MLTFLFILSIIWLVLSLGFKGLMVLALISHIKDNPRTNAKLKLSGYALIGDMVALAYFISYLAGAFK